MNRLPRHTRTLILHSLLRCVSQRACATIFDVSKSTVAKLFQDAGDMAIETVAGFRDLECNIIQADELHSFVGAKTATLRRSQNPRQDVGTIWCYLALEANTKFILDYHVGTREVYDATAFMKSVADRLRRDRHGRFTVRPTIATDGLPAYKEACAIAFGEDADVGMLIKKYSKEDEEGSRLPGSRYIGSDRVVLLGSPNLKDIHTAFIERANLNLRMFNKRYTRKTNAFSKTLLNHERHVALWVLYINFCHIPRNLRVTPAMAQGVSDRPWDVEDLIDLTDAHRAGRVADESDASESAQEPRTDPATHWVYRSTLHYHAKVHEADCYHCKHGDGQRRGTGKAGTWFPFHSLEDAIEAARRFEPDRYSLCTTCLGEMRNQGGYRGPRSR